ncbi:MAG: hypothetical protein IH595_12235 [Bacteroidales bacterium]|nr:hypothetical protein [Bacteroidales bacterium]
MERRKFIQLGGSFAAFLIAVKQAYGFVPAHNWEKYNFGAGPKIWNRLNQGPFPIYAPEAIYPDSDVVMATTPSKKILKNFGMGLVVYISGDIGPPKISGETLEKSIEDLVKIPFVQKIYMRPNWREIQQRQGKLDFPDYWNITFELGKEYKKNIGFRVMLENPDVPYTGAPEFLQGKVPYVRLKGEWKGDPSIVRYRKVQKMPRYDNPAYQKAFEELNALLSEKYNGNPMVEYMDTFMYGFWGEGHTWPFEGNPFPNDRIAEETFKKMFDTQLAYWTKTPLVTNTQPDYSRVGNSEIVDKTIRTNNWIRTDTIFIENMQIESLSNRPSWIAAVSEIGIKTKGELRNDQEINMNTNIINHVMDLGVNYWSVWNWHHISAKNILDYYEKYPESIDEISHKIGYRVRPSWIWNCEKGLIFGMVNDGIADVPGVLRLTVFNEDHSLEVSGELDAGFPKTRGVHQALVELPDGVDWKGLRFKVEIKVKGQLYPVEMSCEQKTNPDGSLTLHPNV